MNNDEPENREDKDSVTRRDLMVNMNKMSILRCKMLDDQYRVTHLHKRLDRSPIYGRLAQSVV